jgi:O-methyltransferase involved in polyketide biosynthesis
MNHEPISGLRLQHFESRYRSLDTLLADSGLTRILELGAGLSFRGLDLAGRNPSVHYLDTDLPERAALKADLVRRLQPAPPLGRLEVLPLDALDPLAFAEAAARLTPGPLAIVDEGLLVYLDPTEKSRLAAHIRDALRAYGGAWLTADVYVRGPAEVRAPLSARAQAFLDRHNVEENKFADPARHKLRGSRAAKATCHSSPLSRYVRYARVSRRPNAALFDDRLQPRLEHELDRTE